MNKEWDACHTWYAYKSIGEINWHIACSEDGSRPKCNILGWFETEQDVEDYIKKI